MDDRRVPTGREVAAAIAEAGEYATVETAGPVTLEAFERASGRTLTADELERMAAAFVDTAAFFRGAAARRRCKGEGSGG